MLILTFLKICFQICYLMCPQINLEIKGRVRVELSVSRPGSEAVEMWDGCAIRATLLLAQYLLCPLSCPTGTVGLGLKAAP